MSQICRFIPHKSRFNAIHNYFIIQLLLTTLYL